MATQHIWDRSTEVCAWVQVAKPDVVVASYEALVSDAASLRALPWDVIAIDERTRQQSTLLRAYQALSAFDSRSRAIVAHPSLLNSVRPAPPAPPDLFIREEYCRVWSGSMGPISVLHRSYSNTQLPDNTVLFVLSEGCCSSSDFSVK